jgi:hypothetical protein
MLRNKLEQFNVGTELDAPDEGDEDTKKSRMERLEREIKEESDQVGEGDEDEDAVGEERLVRKMLILKRLKGGDDDDDTTETQGRCELVVPFPERYAERLREGIHPAAMTGPKRDRDEEKEVRQEFPRNDGSRLVRMGRPTGYFGQLELHNPRGPAEWVQNDDGTTEREVYRVRGEPWRSEPGVTTTDFEGQRRLYEREGLPGVMETQARDGTWVHMATRLPLASQRGNNSEWTSDPAVVNTAMDAWNDEAVRLARSRQVYLDRWQNGGEQLPQAISSLIANNYAAPLPFPPTGTFARPRGRTTGGLRLPDDTDNQIRTTLAALRTLAPSVTRVHGAFQRIVYSFQHTKFPARRKKQKRDDSPPASDDESSSSSDSSQSEDDVAFDDDGSDGGDDLPL